MHYFEFQGPNLEEALEHAVNELQVSRQDVMYKVISADSDNTVIQVSIGSSHAKRDSYSREHDNKRYGQHRNRHKQHYQEETFEATQIFLGLDSLIQQDKAIQNIVSFLQGLFKFFDITLEGFFVDYPTPQEVYINLKCDSPGILIGKQGVILNSLQSILGAHVPKILEEMGEEPTNKTLYTVDIQGYRIKRAKILESMVKKAADQVRYSGKSILLEGEFAPIERRQIHLVAQSLPGIETESQGDKFLKPVLIRMVQ